MTTQDKTMQNEALIVRMMTEDLAKEGWELYQVHDGEEDVNVTSAEEAIDVMNSVEESWIRYRKDGVSKSVYVIPGNGNDGWDLIADHSYAEHCSFSRVMDELTDKIIELESA